MDTLKVITHFSDILKGDIPGDQRAAYTENDPITSVRISKKWLLEKVPEIAGIPEAEVEGWLNKATINDTLDIIDEAVSDYKASGIFHEDVPEELLAWHHDDPRYPLLARLISDCEYYLGAGGYHEKHLWAKSVKGQIAKMKEIYNSFSQEDKPQWVTMAAIDDYERIMQAPKEFEARMEKIEGYKDVTPQEARDRFSSILPDDFLPEEKACIACGADNDYATGWVHSEILLGYHIDIEEWEAARESLISSGHSALNCFEKKAPEKKEIKRILEENAPKEDMRMSIRPWAEHEAHNIYIRQKAMKKGKNKTR